MNNHFKLGVVLVGGLIGLLALPAFADNKIPHSNKILRKIKVGQKVIEITEEDVFPGISINDPRRKNILENEKLLSNTLDGVSKTKALVTTAEDLKLDKEPDLKIYQKFAYEQWMAGRLLEKNVVPQVTDAAAKKYYESHKSEYTSGVVRVQHIFVSDEGFANKILQLAKNPKNDPKNDFQALAESHSIDPSAKINRGELGYINRFSVSRNFAQAAFNASVGDVVGPIKEVNGYRIIKIKEKKPGSIMGYAEVEMMVKAALREKLANEYTENLYSQVN